MNVYASICARAVYRYMGDLVADDDLNVQNVNV